MNRRARFLLSIVVGGIFCAFYLGKKVQWALQVQSTQTSFEFGRKVEPGTTWEKGCGSLGGLKQVFCIEGQSFQQMHARLSSVPSFPENIGEFNLAIESKFMPLQAVALGLALSEVKVGPSQLLTLLELGTLKSYLPYIIDGWSFRNMENFGQSRSLKMCEALIDPQLLRPCLWGLGRGLFFEFRLFSISSGGPDILAGYEFARSFSNNFFWSDYFNLKKTGSPGEIADLAKRHYVSNETMLQGANSLFKCLRQKHPVFCYAKPS